MADRILMNGTAAYAGLEAVVFDLDGTLVDSIPDITVALNAGLANAGLPAVTERAVKGMVGHGARELVADAVRAAGAGRSVVRRGEQIFADYMAAYDAVPCAKTRVYPGVVVLLDELRKAGVRLGICTNKPISTTELVLSALGLRAYFDAIAGGVDAVPLKPAPDMVRNVLRDLGTRTSRSILVGDSAADAGAGHAAGLRVVLLEHGYGGPNLRDVPAEALAASFADLGPILQRLARVTA